MDISVGVPVYNSENILPELIRQFKDALKEFEYEIILVNDESPDKSWDVILKEILSNYQFIGVNLRKNSSLDNAIIAGLKYRKPKWNVKNYPLLY
ncbi:glycosyltransferase [Treponema primitia]|uniref:glycosyltransferase n=1 Tax=Treponema primitia TaxID=88058 RepID=UPI00025556A4|nr:glycosyltransferase [Treponema primitia]